MNIPINMIGVMCHRMDVGFMNYMYLILFDRVCDTHVTSLPKIMICETILYYRVIELIFVNIGTSWL